MVRGYTTIEQSRKLAEILPIESAADMWWAEKYTGQVMENGQYIVEENPVYYPSFTKPSNVNYSQDVVKDIPCWSLAALLNILDYPQLSKDKLGSGKAGWMVSAYPNDCRYDSCWHDNPVDACVEMIIRLHEQNLL